MGYSQKFISSSILLNLSQFINSFLILGSNIILARLLTPEIFGVYFLALSSFELINMIGSFGFPLAIIQAKKINQVFIDTNIWLNIILGIFIFIFVTLVVYLNPFSYPSNVLYMIIIFAFVELFKRIGFTFSKVIERNLNYKMIAIINIVQTSIGLIVALVVAYYYRTFWSLILRDISFIFVSFVSFYYLSKYKFRFSFSREFAKSIFKYGKNVLLIRAMETFIVRYKEWVIGNFINKISLGFFSQATKFAEYGQRFGGPAINMVSFAVYSRLIDVESQKKSTEKIHYVLIRIFIVISFFILVFGKNIVILLYGKNWENAGRMLQYLAPYILCVTPLGNIKQFFMSINKMQNYYKVQLFQIFLFIIIFTPIIYFFNIYIGIIVLDCIYALALVLGYYFLYKEITFDFKNTVIRPILIFGLIIVLLSFFFDFSIIYSLDDLRIKVIYFIIINSIFAMFLFILEKEIFFDIYGEIKASVKRA